jgi:hypothetical protein
VPMNWYSVLSFDIPYFARQTDATHARRIYTGL